MTEQTGSTKDLLYGFQGNFSCGIERVVPSGQDGSILPSQSHLALSGNQSHPAIWFILRACGASHIISYSTVFVLGSMAYNSKFVELLIHNLNFRSLLGKIFSNYMRNFLFCIAFDVVLHIHLQVHHIKFSVLTYWLLRSLNLEPRSHSVLHSNTLVS